MEQTSEDWDGINDADFLEIQLEKYRQDAHQLLSQSSTTEDISNRSSTSSSASSHRTESKSEETTPVKSDEDRGEKRKRDAKRACRASLRFSKRHLSVSNLCDQAWCEMKLVYGFLHPHMKRAEKQRPEMQAGIDFHLTRELEVHEVVPVSIQSREDTMAVKLLNILQMLPVLEAGQCVREFPVFGVLEGVYIMGVIDELSYNQKGELVLNELKTRMGDSLPGDAQALTHCFQVSLYKLLFDALIRGEVKREHIIKHLGLQASQPLGTGIFHHATCIELQVDTFGQLVDTFLLSLSCSDIPCIDLLQLEYRHQGTGVLIGTKVAPFDEAQVRAELQRYLSYWTGQREPRGVEIEEAWKCRMCPYQEMCEWRKSSLQGCEVPHTSKRSKSTDTADMQ